MELNTVWEEMIIEVRVFLENSENEFSVDELQVLIDFLRIDISKAFIKG